MRLVERLIERIGRRAVASAAGVSEKTVTLALRQYRTGYSAGVRPETVRNIVRIASDLGYLERAYPRAKRETARIGVVIPDVGSLHYDEFARTFARAASERNMSVIIQTASSDSPDLEERAADIFRPLELDAVVLASSRVSDQFAGSVDQGRTLLVSVDRVHDQRDTRQSGREVHIRIDHEGAAREAVLRLVDKGYERIAYIAGPARSQANTAKRDGYDRALAERGKESRYVFPEDPEGRYNIEAGRIAAQSLITELKTDPGSAPDAVFVYSDEMALGVLQAIYEADLSVKDLAVLGFDGVTIGAHWNPTLSTVQIPRVDIAQRVLQTISLALDGKPYQREIVSTPFYLPRLSTPKLKRVVELT